MDDEFRETDSPQEGRHGEKGIWPCPGSFTTSDRISCRTARRNLYRRDLGLGGHSWEIAKRLGAQGRLIGFDKDPAALERARERLMSPPTEWERIGRRSSWCMRHLRKLRNMLLLSRRMGCWLTWVSARCSWIIAARGFSFQAEGPLDMRMNTQAGQTAEQVVNRFDERELADAIYEFGEERRSRRIARAIVRARPITTTAQLAQVVSAAARPMNQAERRIHPATKTFQALRILVNRELEDLQDAASCGRCAAGPAAGREAGDHQLPLAGRSHCERRVKRRSARGQVPGADQKAGNC